MGTPDRIRAGSTPRTSDHRSVIAKRGGSDPGGGRKRILRHRHTVTNTTSRHAGHAREKSERQAAFAGSATGRRLVIPSASCIAVCRAGARMPPIRNAAWLGCARHASSGLLRGAFTVGPVALRCGSSLPPSDGSKPGSRRGAVRAVPDRSLSAVCRARIVSVIGKSPGENVRRAGRRRVAV